MSAASLLLSILTAVNIDAFFPWLFQDSIKYWPLGSILSFAFIKLLSFAGLKKISGILSFWPLYTVLICLTIFANTSLNLTIFILGGFSSLLLNFIIGFPTSIYNPFKTISLRFPLQQPITVFISFFLIASGLNILLDLGYNSLLLALISIIIASIYYIFSTEIQKTVSAFRVSSGFISEQQRRKAKLEILLADLSVLWNRKNAVIELEELARSSWLSHMEKPCKEKKFNFIEPEIAYYWDNIIYPSSISANGKIVIGNILEYLEKYGSCSSVVADNYNKSYKNNKDNLTGLTSYEILATYSLTTHSLNVAKGLETKEFINYRHSQEKLIIASLGHDLGKVTGHQNSKHYITTDHPANSIMILESEIDGYSDLKYKDETNQIILSHHKGAGDDKPLVKVFMSMDATARRYELSQYIQKHRKTKDTNSIANQISEQAKPLKSEYKAVDPTPPLPPMPPNVSNGEQTGQINTKNDAEDSKLKNINIPNFIEKPKHGIRSDNALFRDMLADNGKPGVMELPWLDLDKFIASVNLVINKVETGWFKAVTVNGDMVLVLTTYVWQLLKKQAFDAGFKEIAEISNNDMDNETKKSVLMSFVEILWYKHYIHDKWIKKNYYNAKFTLLDPAGNETEAGWFIPFRIEAFKEFNLYEDYELRKSGKTANIVSAKVPQKS